MSVIELTEENWKILKKVHKDVNKFKYVTDQKRFKVEEWWTYIDEKGGDCEDYALEKRRRLLELGFPAEALLIAICVVPGGGHAVLTIETDKGTFVMDNNSTSIYPWKKPPYPIKWIGRQSKNLGLWEKF